MPSNHLTIEAAAQEVLDELWSEKLIPFPLKVAKVTTAPAEYAVHFYDIRLSTAFVPIIKDLSFRELVRTSVVARAAELEWLD